MVQREWYFRNCFVKNFLSFLSAVQLPIKDNAWPYGPEYVFVVHMNVTGIPECPHYIRACGDPSGYRITSRLHCIPKRNDTLSCSLRHVDGFDFGMIGEEDDVAKRRKNITEAPVELFFNEEGVRSIVTSQFTRMYDLNILRMVAEQLHPGDDLDNVGDGTFEGAATSTVGRCNVTFDVYHRRSGTENRAKRLDRGFRLELLPWKLQHITSTETLVIDKITNLNDCSCYADSYFRKYGDTVVYERSQADLVSYLLIVRKYLKTIFNLNENPYVLYLQLYSRIFTLTHPLIKFHFLFLL